MQKKWIAGGLLVLGLLGMCGCSSQAFVSEQQTETVLTQEETGCVPDSQIHCGH